MPLSEIRFRSNRKRRQRPFIYLVLLYFKALRIKVSTMLSSCFCVTLKVHVSFKMSFIGACLQARGLNLSCVRSCVVIAEERPRLALTQSFSKLFKDLGLSPRAVSTAFGSRVNLAICLQVVTYRHTLPLKHKKLSLLSHTLTVGFHLNFKHLGNAWVKSLILIYLAFKV